MPATIDGIRACVFDAYGTLFDFASAPLHCEDELGEKVKPLTALWRDKQLQYTWLRALQHRHADFWQVTGDALDYAMETLGLASPALRARLMNLYLSLETFPEVPGVLRQLKARGLVTAILSNGTPHMLSAAVNAAGLTPHLDAVLSVEDAGVYKPHPDVYQLAVDRLGIPAEAIAFQSSNAWDAYAASAFGMRVVWCNRYKQRPERLPGNPDAVIQSLDELPALLGRNQD
ncbi:MAG: haloacid dehalogenase type II [Opitutaceae bacterium]|nr:haloacid dehalogenase type II [Opitutaceae bacterium]